MSLPVLIAVLGVVILILVLGAVVFLRGSKSGPRKVKDSATIIRTANRTLSQNPKDVIALSAIGEVYFAEQNWEKAATIYSKLNDLVATHSDLDENLILMRHGLASMQLKRYEDAYQSLLLAWRENKEVFEINFSLGHLELIRKSYERAVPLLKVAHQERPDHLPTARYLGQGLFRLKHYSDAIRALRKVVQVDPSDKECLYFLGQASYELGQTDQAAKIFRQLRTDPKYGPRASLIAGSLHLKARVYNEAEIDFQIGLKHSSVPPEVLLELKYRLSATYTRMQDIETALAVLLEIARVNPQYKDVAEQIERNRELAGNKNLQTFLISPSSEFVGLCRRVVSSYFHDSSAKITDINVSRGESADFLAEIRTPKWEDLAVFRFMRTTGQTGELVVRDLQSRMKEIHAGRGYCLSAGGFSEGAHEFVEARFIDLIEKDAFLKILQRS